MFCFTAPCKLELVLTTPPQDTTAAADPMFKVGEVHIIDVSDTKVRVVHAMPAIETVQLGENPVLVTFTRVLATTVTADGDKLAMVGAAATQHGLKYINLGSDDYTT